MNYDPGEFADTQPLAGMKLWACSYTKDGQRFGINLRGTSADQVLNDNCDAFDDFNVDGEVVATAPAVPRAE